MISCVVFDFDGTLVLSNKIKRDGFFALADRYSGGREVMTRVLEEQPGDRFAITDRFTRAIGLPLEASALAQWYTQWCEDRIVACDERTGASALVAALRAAVMRLYINSATPTSALCSIIERRFPAGAFDGVYGGSGSKVSNLQAIARHAAASMEELVMIGDGIDDLEAAQEAGCHFIGVAGGTLSTLPRSPMLVSDLRDVQRLIDRLQRPSQPRDRIA